MILFNIHKNRIWANAWARNGACVSTNAWARIKVWDGVWAKAMARAKVFGAWARIT
jgi:hypothetical protein